MVLRAQSTTEDYIRANCVIRLVSYLVLRAQSTTEDYIRASCVIRLVS